MSTSLHRSDLVLNHKVIQGRDPLLKLDAKAGRRVSPQLPSGGTNYHTLAPGPPTNKHINQTCQSRVLTMPYLLIRWVVLPITCVQVEASILTRNLVPHGAFESTVVNKKHCK